MKLGVVIGAGTQKETWALICWLVYAAYLHTRLSRGWQGRRPALVAVVGLIVIAVCYIGVNSFRDWFA